MRRACISFIDILGVLDYEYVGIPVAAGIEEGKFIRYPCKIYN